MLRFSIVTPPRIAQPENFHLCGSRLSSSPFQNDTHRGLRLGLSRPSFFSIKVKVYCLTLTLFFFFSYARILSPLLSPVLVFLVFCPVCLPSSGGASPLFGLSWTFYPPPTQECIFIALILSQVLRGPPSQASFFPFLFPWFRFVSSVGSFTASRPLFAENTSVLDLTACPFSFPSR